MEVGNEARPLGRTMKPSRLGPVCVAVLLVLPLLVPSQALAATDSNTRPELWPQDQREFFFDGPAFLLDKAEREQLLSATVEERAQFIEAFLARDPDTATPNNELAEAIEKRRALVRSKFVTFLDERAKLLFLHGAPDELEYVDCDQVFRPLEIWGYGPEESRQYLLLYRPGVDDQFKLWLPLDSKRALYADEMEYWLDQYEELRRFLSGRRFDKQLCRQARRVDRISGVDGLSRIREGGPTQRELAAFLAPPSDLTAWARKAKNTKVDLGEPLAIEKIEIDFPREQQQRLMARIAIWLPADTTLKTFTDEVTEQSEYRVLVDGVLEQEGRQFEDFKVRFKIPHAEVEAAAADAGEKPIVLVIERPVRKTAQFLLRMRVRDEIGPGRSYITRGFDVPLETTKLSDTDLEGALVVADELARTSLGGVDSLLLVPPGSDVVLGLWRAETLVTGDRIAKVKFLVDGKVQMTRGRAPWSGELRLTKYPTEQVIRAEGYDSSGELVASDELIVNQQRGELRVRITDPPRGRVVAGEAEAEVQIVIPEERQVAAVEFLVNDELQARVETPPWRAKIDAPVAKNDQDVVYLTVTAELDDGSRAEDVRFLNMPDFVDSVDVDLVELYTTVNDRNGGIALGLGEGDFEIKEDGRPQEIARFELVDDLPITLGVTIDTSGSMLESLGEARRAAVEFLETIIRPKDQSFVFAFSNKPELIMPRTSDVSASASVLQDLSAIGMTSLHDAVVTSLYYFRSVKGRRALVLLSDGDDTASTIPFQDSLEYARRSGVAIYTIGLNIGRLDIGVRNKLRSLSNETGGRAFFISKAQELSTVYGQIEKELRSQYLLAYNSDRPATSAESDEFRTVAVKVKKAGLKARTIRGYYP